MIGSYGNRWANKALAECDLLLVLGSRLDVRQTGADVAPFESKTIIHVDVDLGELDDNRVPGTFKVRTTTSAFCRAVLNEPRVVAAQWIREVGADQAEELAPYIRPGRINPNDFLRRLSHGLPAAYVVDVGAHQMWAAQSIEVGARQRFITSGGLGAMGFALPAAIGATIAWHRLPRPIVVVAGDGGMMVNIQEMDTIERLNLPIKIVVMNNGSLGMVRQFQDAYCNGRRQSTMPPAPNFEAIAESYGIAGTRIAHSTEIPAGLGHLWENPLAPALLEVMIGPNVNAYPKLAFGRGLTEMEP
jgi:acetolactate synthase-1/2/3 large subunit